MNGERYASMCMKDIVKHKNKALYFVHVDDGCDGGDGGGGDGSGIVRKTK